MVFNLPNLWPNGYNYFLFFLSKVFFSILYFSFTHLLNIVSFGCFAILLLIVAMATDIAYQFNSEESIYNMVEICKHLWNFSK